MDKSFWKRKPVGETILAKVSRDLAMKKAGIDPRSPAERARDEEKRREAVRSFDRYKTEL